MRFRSQKGSMLVISPENEAVWKDVMIVYDKENDAFGIQLIGESQLKGYSFFVPQESFKQVRDRGLPSEELKAPR